MPNHVRTRASARPLPTAKPVQLSLPGIPEPRYSLLVTVTVTVKKHRYPLSLAALILFLFLIGQGFVAGAVACGAGLYLINNGVDRSFGKYLDQRGNKHVR